MSSRVQTGAKDKGGLLKDKTDDKMQDISLIVAEFD
jgi:hypothetical protein